MQHVEAAACLCESKTGEVIIEARETWKAAEVGASCIASMSHRISLFNSYPLYGSPPLRDGGSFGFFRPEWGIVAGAAIAACAILFVTLGLALLAEVWWYHRHGSTLPQLAALRRRLVQRFALYWLALSVLALLTLLTLWYLVLARL